MLPAIIGGVSSLLGGLFNKSQNDANNRAAQENALRQEALQREFAQNGISWKVQDAKRSGIHPLFALGAQTTSFTPQSFGGSADTSMGNAIASSGQNLSRAIAATQTAEDRQKTAAADALTLEKAGLENELLRTQIVSLRSRQIGPAMPTLTSPNGSPIKTDDIKQQPDDVPTKAINRLFGIPLRSNPYMADAESTENRFSNIPENIQGLANIPADMAYTLYKDYPAILQWMQHQLRGAARGGATVRKYIYGK